MLDSRKNAYNLVSIFGRVKCVAYIYDKMFKTWVGIYNCNMV